MEGGKESAHNTCLLLYAYLVRICLERGLGYEIL